ncbi:secondary thiamine-phosphate synthase enzyme YjbQ [Aureimonas mangrovi]|uniref:secondary thiamine-phosphate synthase enzyme YjbQ n=1 Tax=Aureimonas mangrovi TaxID=2758041 RepID=UPI00163DA27E|nr:secondary thiamine-phosphate synthase enzyme YjbQ [Aureimonas mangrovi]
MQKPEQLRPLMFVERFAVETRGREMRDITAPVAKLLREHGAAMGLATIFVRHTSASLTIQENADPDVRADLLDAFERLAPRDFPYRHDVEGPDDMPAHIKSAITATSVSVPVEGGSMLLGIWQGLYLVEHRDRPHRREVAIHFAGTMR